MSKKCGDCLWADGCSFERPCEHYTPLDYEEKLEERDETRLKRRYTEEWREYAEYCDDIFFDM